VWSGHVYRVYAARRTIAAENKLDADQESKSCDEHLDLGVGVEAAVSAATNFVMIKGRPPRLGQIFQTYAPPLFFVTICTIHRQKIGDLEAAHHAFEAYIRRARDEFGVVVGRYVMMPDHIHLFVRGNNDFNLARWGQRVETRNFSGARSNQETTALAAGLFRSHLAQRRELQPEMGIRARESCSCRTGCTGRRMALSR
jgi:REP element-mobilizing transposase RayT